MNEMSDKMLAEILRDTWLSCCLSKRISDAGYEIVKKRSNDINWYTAFKEAVSDAQNFSKEIECLKKEIERIENVMSEERKVKDLPEENKYSENEVELLRSKMKDLIDENNQLFLNIYHLRDIINKHIGGLRADSNKVINRVNKNTIKNGSFDID